MALLPLPEPYDFAVSTERFRTFGPDLVNLWHEGGLHRVVAGREVRIEPAPGGVRVQQLDAGAEPLVRRLLGLDFDLSGFARWSCRADPVIRRLAGRLRGFRPPLVPDPFEALVTSITAQQVSLRAALAIRNRLIERFGKRAGRAYAFPSRTRIADASEDELLAAGLSRRKAEYLLRLARADLDLDTLAGLPDGKVKERLTALRGLGEWTADWFLARHLGRARVWPAGDLGLQKAVRAFYGEVDVRAAGDRFDPFQNLTAHYLLAGMRVVGT